MYSGIPLTETNLSYSPGVMDCATGILIDLDKSQESVKQELIKCAAVTNDVSESSVLETRENLFLNKQLCSVNVKTNHSAPTCGILVDLDSPFNGSELGEAVMQPSVEIKVRGCDNSRFAEQNNCNSTLYEKSNVKFSSFLNERGSSSSSGGSRNGVNFTWSPSIIYNDVDLLENEKFDFNLSISSISPHRGTDDGEVFIVEENVCNKCKKDKPLKLSTPQKDWSLLNAAFISEISEEASKVVTHLSEKKKPPQKSAADARKFPSVLLNSSFSVSQHNDSSTEEQDYNFYGNEIPRNSSFKNDSDDCDALVYPNETDDCSLAQTEYVKKKSESLFEMTRESSAEMNTKTSILGRICESIDDCIVSNLNAIQAGTDVFNKVAANIAGTENKENIPLNLKETESSAFGDYSNNTEIKDRTVNSLLQKPPSSEQKCKILNSSCLSKDPSPLVRRDTFTVKSSPLQASIRSTLRNKGTNISCERNDVSLKEVKKKFFPTPKSAVHRVQQNASFNNRSLSSTSKKANTPNTHTFLTHKEPCTEAVRPVVSQKDVPTFKTPSPLVHANYDTSNKSTVRSLVMGKARSLSCKMATKSRFNSPPGNASTSSSKVKSPNGTVSCGFKTPTMPKRTSMLPSRLSYSQSCAAISTNTKAGTYQRSSPKVMRANSFQFQKCVSATGLASKRPSAQGSKPRASSAGETSDSGLDKKTMAIKATVPLSNMVKTSAVIRSSGTDSMSNASGNEGNPVAAVASRGLGARHVSAVVKSEQAKRSNSLSTPKSVSTPSKPRFLSQSDTPKPVLLKKDAGIRRLSFVPTPKRFTPK